MWREHSCSSYSASRCYSALLFTVCLCSFVNAVVFLFFISVSLQCLYCEKTFRDKTTLKDHMRKKAHRRINGNNSEYDRFYVINYLVKTTKLHHAWSFLLFWSVEVWRFGFLSLRLGSRKDLAPLSRSVELLQLLNVSCQMCLFIYSSIYFVFFNLFTYPFYFF